MKILLLLIFIPFISLVLTNVDSSLREGRYAHIRNMKLQWQHQNLLNQVSGDNKLQINSIGLKGDELGQEKHRILVIGNSLSEGMLLDDKETWPYQLQALLNKNGFDVKVFNAAKSGFMSAQRIVDVFEAYKHIKPNLIIIYPLGVFNKDYSPREGFSEYYIPDFKNHEISLSNNTVIQQLRNRKWEIAAYFKKRFGVTLFRNAIADPNHVRGIKTAVEHRKKLSKYKMNPQYISEYKAKFEKGLNYVINYFNNQSIPLYIIDRLHVTNIQHQESDLSLWWHDTIIDKDGVEKRFSSDDYAKIISLEHQVTKLIKNKQIKVITQEKLNPNPKWFYDQHHLNEYGSKEFANKLKNIILKQANYDL